MPREVLSLAAVACDVCAPTNPQIQPCREGSKDRQNPSHLCLPTLTFLTTSGTVSSPLPKSLSTSCVPGALIPLSLPGLAYTVFHTTSPSTPIHPPGQLCLAFSSPDHRDTWAPHGDRAFTLGPALTHYRCQRVYIVSSCSERITLTLAHFPLPLFHFAATDLPPPPTPDPFATHPSPTLDGTDLIGRVFNDPDLGLCRVVEVGPPHRLAPGEGNFDPTGPQIQAGWVPTLRYTSLGGATHTSSATEVAEWVQTLAPPDTSPYGRHKQRGQTVGKRIKARAAVTGRRVESCKRERGYITRTSFKGTEADRKTQDNSV